MGGRQPGRADCLAFELERLEHYRDWTGRLTVAWPKPAQNWWRWAGRGRFTVESIVEESRFVQRLSDWRELVLNWHELRALPSSWKSALAQWRGIYLNYDITRQKGYVGSACGAENILSRWSEYARTGHGGNVELKASAPADLRFSMLQLTAQDLEPSAVVALEASWKRRLHTREYGLNRN